MDFVFGEFILEGVGSGPGHENMVEKDDEKDEEDQVENFAGPFFVESGASHEFT